MSGSHSFRTLRDTMGDELCGVLDTYITSKSSLESCAAAEVAMEWAVAYLLLKTRRPETSRDAAAAVADFNIGVAGKLSQLMIERGLRRDGWQR